MDILIFCLALALLMTTYLAWRNHTEILQLKRDRNLAIELGKRSYADGHEHGLQDAYKRATGEMEAASRKAAKSFDLGYQEGWEAALLTAQDQSAACEVSAA